VEADHLKSVAGGNLQAMQLFTRKANQHTAEVSELAKFLALDDETCYRKLCELADIYYTYVNKPLLDSSNTPFHLYRNTSPTKRLPPPLTNNFFCASQLRPKIFKALFTSRPIKQVLHPNLVGFSKVLHKEKIITDAQLTSILQRHSDAQT